MWQDIRYGLRMLTKNPGFTAVAVIALALGIASTTAIFSVVNAVLLHPLPYPDSDRIVVVVEESRATAATSVLSPANYVDAASRNTVFSNIAAVRTWIGNLSGGDHPERVKGIMATASFFSLFGINPIAGRTLQPQDEHPGSDHVVVLSYGLWTRRYAADRKVLGKDIILNGEKYKVIGIMPPQFSPDRYGELWLPSPWGVPTHVLWPNNDPRPLRDRHYLDVWARLKPGVTQQQAMAQLDALGRQMEKENPNSNKDRRFRISPYREDLVGDVRPALLILLGAVGLVLLIGCANVANLLLARATMRAKEISIRAALGAGRLRLARQLLTESILLALLGGIIGVLLASWAVPALVALSPPEISDFQNIGVQKEVLLFSLGVSTLCGILFGLVPAFHVSRSNMNESLKQGERGSTGSHLRIHSALVVAEVGLSLILLAGAGLLIKSFIQLIHVNPGFETNHLLVFNLALPPSAEDSEKTAFYTQALNRLQSVPGVNMAGAVSRLPLSGGNSTRSYMVVGTDQYYEADIRVTTPDYFRAMGIPLLKGRYFAAQDREGSPYVIIVNEALAKSVFPGQDPIGKRIDNYLPESGQVDLEIVGVVGNVRHLGLETAPRPEIYQPLGQAQWFSMDVVLRTAMRTPAGMATAVQNAVWSVNKDVPLADIRTMQQVISNSVQRRTFTVLLLTIFAGLAVVLSAIGLYGVMSYSVSQRTQEIGIRVALGAKHNDVVRLIVGQGMTRAALGIAIGILVSLLLGRLISGLLFGVSPTDAFTFVLITAILAFVAFLANYIPARRATKVDPIIALRYE